MRRSREHVRRVVDAAVPTFLALAGILAASAADGESAPLTAGARPTLAVEDTLPAVVSEPYPEILVTAPRQSLDEILRHVAEGEAIRDSMIQDQAFTLYTRMVGRDSKEAPAEENEPYFESATRIYQKRPGKVRVVPLKSWSRDEKKNGKKEKKGVEVRVDSDMSEQFVGFAFDPATRSRFRFRIEDRKIIGDQVVYVLGFSPRSPIEPLPTGRVWVNTNDFVILREEFSYRDRSPAPFLLESLDTCVIERTRIDGRYWVISRVLARITLADPVRWLGRTAGEKVPKVADFAATWTDWIINGGIPDSLFSPSTATGDR